jgi:hypothetical protein
MFRANPRDNSLAQHIYTLTQLLGPLHSLTVSVVSLPFVIAVSLTSRQVRPLASVNRGPTAVA